MNRRDTLVGWWMSARRRPEAWSAAIWSVVYLAVAVTGQNFSTAYLNFGWQLVPWDVLSSDPFRSVWYLHVQPPLWNLVLGVASWTSPASDAITLQIVMFAIGVALAASCAALAGRLGAGARAATVIAVVATVQPEVLKGAFEPNYELAVALLLVLVAVAIGRLESVSRRRLVELSVVLTVLVMTRSLYHPLVVVLVLAVAFVAVRHRIDRRTVAVVIAVPLVVVGGWIVKNQVLFGTPNLSSWFGMNLQRAVIPVLPRADLEKMYADGEVSEIALIGPFGRYDLYADVAGDCEPHHSHRSVSEPMRTTDEYTPNFNYECYIPLFERAGRDAWAVIRAHPEAWIEGRLWSLRTTFAVATLPAESDSFVMRALDSTASVARLDYRGVLSTAGWGTPIYGRLEAPADFSLTLVAIYAALVALGLRNGVRWVRRRTISSTDLVVLVASFLAAFTIVVGAVAELGEQSRFRTATDPLAVVVVVVAVANVVKRRRTQSQAEAVG